MWPVATPSPPQRTRRRWWRKFTLSFPAEARRAGTWGFSWHRYIHPSENEEPNGWWPPHLKRPYFPKRKRMNPSTHNTQFFGGFHVGCVLRLKGVSYLKTGMTFREVGGGVLNFECMSHVFDFKTRGPVALQWFKVRDKRKVIQAVTFYLLSVRSLIHWKGHVSESQTGHLQNC